jgi:GINS complex subunit 1
LAHLLSTPTNDAEAPDLRSALSPQELDFLRGYNNLILDYKSDFLDVLDLTGGIEKPPGELMVDVRVVKDAGAERGWISEKGSDLGWQGVQWRG